MFFRNLTLFRFPTSLQLDALAAGLAECALRPVGPMELSTQGFISPFGRNSEGLHYELDGVYWLSVGREVKDLPGSAVNARLQAKLDEIEQKEGRRPGGRTRKRLKDEIVTDMLPHAFMKPARIDAILDTRTGLLAVDTSSRKTAESVVSEVRRALGSFPALPINAEVAPRSVMTGWVAGEALPDGLALGDAAELRDALDQGAVVKLDRMELENNAEVDKHLQSGKQVTRLALSLDDHVSFVLGEDLAIRKFKLLDGAVDTLENTDREDLRAELEARFALMSHELRRLFSVLSPALKLSKLDTDPPDVDDALRELARRVEVGMRSRGYDGVSVSVSAVGSPNEADPLLEKARAIVCNAGRVSIAGIQRKLEIGYNRAARLVEALEAAGVVSAADADGAREVLMKE